MSSKWRILGLAVLLFIFSSSPKAYANGLALISRGVARTLFSVVEIPKEMITRAPQAFPLGLIGGTAVGAMKAVAGTAFGAVDIARGAAPYAKYAIFFV